MINTLGNVHHSAYEKFVKKKKWKNRTKAEDRELDNIMLRYTLKANSVRTWTGLISLSSFHLHNNDSIRLS
jgi:hypothetical protein